MSLAWTEERNAPSAWMGPALRALAWAAALALTALLIANTLPFFVRPERMAFFEEKGVIGAQPLWRAAVYVHVVGGMLCLVTAPALFSRRLLVRAPALHRALGWTYVASVLVGLLPAGILLIPTAAGGVWGRGGFALLAGWLLVATVAGLRRVLARDFVGHRAWMVRSYALAASALSFRVFFVLFQALGLASAYEMGIWASFGTSVVLGEAWVRRLSPRSSP